MSVNYISTSKKLFNAAFAIAAAAVLVFPIAVNAQVMVEPSAVAQHNAVNTDEHKNQIAQTGEFKHKQEQVEVKNAAPAPKTAIAQKPGEQTNEKQPEKKTKASNKLFGFFGGMFTGSDDHSMGGACFTSP